MGFDWVLVFLAGEIVGALIALAVADWARNRKRPSIKEAGVKR